MVCEVVIAKTELAHIVLAKSINAPFISDREREVFSCCHSHVYWLRSLLYIPFTKNTTSKKRAKNMCVVLFFSFFGCTTRTHGRGAAALLGPPEDEITDMGVHDAKLVLAIEEHDVDTTRLLLLKISNINFQTKQRRTALHAAVQHNNIVAATMLLERGAGMNVLPMNKTDQTIRQCPMLLAFKMGESHEKMQLLFLRKLKVIRDTWLSAPDQAIIALIPKYAMQYSTPLVFFDAIGESGGANISNEGLSPLMHTLKELALSSIDAADCVKTMENVFKMLDKYPAMAWERLEATVKVTGISPIVYPQGSTALGMLVFHSMPARHKINMEFVEMGDELLQLQEEMNAAMSSTDPVCLVQQQAVEADRQKNAAIITYLNTELIPDFFTRMLRPMRVALAMATHVRLGEDEGCCAKGLSTDAIDIIFNGLVRDIVERPDVLTQILC